MIRTMIISLAVMLLTFNYTYNILELGGHISIVLTLVAWVIVGLFLAKITEAG